MSINHASVSGNLTRDAELRATQGGLQVLSFAVAVNERRKNQQTGEWEDCPSFIDCTMFGERAAKLSDWLRKGTKVAVSGRLRQRSWEAQDGSKRSKVEVVVDDLDVMSQRQQQKPQAQVEPDDYDLPF